MSRYDGLIIPRSYSEYINKTDAATLSQALQLDGVLDSAPTEDSVKAVKSGGVYTALAALDAAKQDVLTFDNAPAEDSNNPVKSGGIYNALAAMEIPVGTIIAQYKKAAPTGYLYLDGSTFDAAEYPRLYVYLGNSNTLPDYREYALVGAEQNSTDTIAAHDVYTEGEGKDDQLQTHAHDLTFANTLYLNYFQTTAAPGNNMGGLGTRGTSNRNLGSERIYNTNRTGDVTRGKRKAVFYYIKAVSIADIL